MFSQLVCPISNEKIDSNVSRLTIFISVILVTIFMVTDQRILLYIAATDYFIRAFTSGKVSPLRFVALQVSNVLNWTPKMINKAPKVFAARLGFICLFSSAVLVNLGYSTASIVTASMACSLFVLDALGIVCLGCVIYHHLVFPFFKK